MAKIDSNQILKEGVVLRVEKIDFESKEVRSQVQKTERRQKQVQRLQRIIVRAR